MWLRVILGLFLLAHGAGHVAWFLAAFFPGTQPDVSYRIAGSREAAPGFVGRAAAVLALAAAAGFVAAGVGVFTAAGWWVPPAVLASIGSVIVAMVWWNPVGLVSVMALLGNGAVLAAVAIPWVGEVAGLD